MALGQSDLERLREEIVAEVISPEQVARDELENIRGYNKKLNAFITMFDPESGRVLRQLKNLKAARKNDRLRVSMQLYGIPFTIKDNVFFSGYRTTAGSGVFQNFVPRVNADVVDLFLSAGAVPLGKTNLHELAMGATSTSSFSGPVRNPVDPDRISGGSSGGSAVSVAKSRHPLVSIGTDTGGSVRIPAALCGVCGFKPTIGTFSTFGVFPLSATLDHVGILTKTTADMITAFRALSGPSANVALAHSVRANRRKKENSKLPKHKIGIPNNYFFEGSQKEVLKSFWNAVEKIRDSDLFEIVENVLVPDYTAISHVRRSIHVKEAAWFYAELVQKPELRAILHKDVMTFFDAGSKVGMMEYMMASTERLSFIAKMSQLFKTVDFLAMPTCLCVAPKLNDVIGKEASSMRKLLVKNTEPFNLCGFPALALPMHRLDSTTLPRSIQIAGAYCDDLRVLEACDRVWCAIHGHA